jgi:hypothetical protein
MRRPCGGRVCAFGLSAVLLVGCAGPTKHVSVDVELGVMIDNETGFHARRTSLPAVPAESVDLVLLTEDRKTGRTIVHLPHPVVSHTYSLLESRRYLHPDDLRQILAGSGPSEYPEAPGKTVELGYFQHTVRLGTSTYNLKKTERSSPTMDLEWGILPDKADGKIAEMVEDFRAYAASYGADAIVDLAVFSGSLPSVGSIPRHGIWITGTAVVFDRPTEDVSAQPAVAGT